MFDSMSDNVRSIVLEKSRRIAADSKAEKVHPEHILLSLLASPDCVAARFLERKGSAEKIAAEVGLLAKNLPAAKNGTPAEGISFSEETKRVIDKMGDEANQLGSEMIGTEHLLLAMIDAHEPIRKLLKEKFDVTYGQVREALKPAAVNEGAPEGAAGVPGSPKTVRVNPIMGAVFFAPTMTAKDIDIALFAIEQIKGVQFSQPMPVPAEQAEPESGIVPGRFTGRVNPKK